MSFKVKIFPVIMERRPLLSKVKLETAMVKLGDPANLLDDKEFSEAFRVSQPELFQKIMKSENLKEFTRTVQNYYLRAATHSTPRHYWAGWWIPNTKNDQDQIHFLTEKDQSLVFYVNPNLTFGENFVSGWQEMPDNSVKNIFLQISKGILIEIRKFLESQKSVVYFDSNLKLSKKLVQFGVSFESLLAHGLVLKKQNRKFFTHSMGRSAVKDFKEERKKNQEIEVQFLNPSVPQDEIEATIRHRAEDLRAAIGMFHRIFSYEQHNQQNSFLANRFFAKQESQLMNVNDFSVWYARNFSCPENLAFRATMHESFSTGLIGASNSETIHLDQHLDRLELLERTPRAQRLDHTTESNNQNLYGQVFIQNWEQEKIYLKYVCAGVASAPYARHTMFSEEMMQVAKQQNLFQKKLTNTDFVIAQFDLEDPNRRGILSPQTEGYDKRLNFNSPTQTAAELSLQDVLISSDGTRFNFFHARTKEKLHLRQNNLYLWTGEKNMVYRVLLSAAYQDIPAMNTFSHVLFPGAPVNSRVEYKGIILCPRRWKIPVKIISAGLDATLNYLLKENLPRVGFFMRSLSATYVDLSDFQSFKYLSSQKAENGFYYFEEAAAAKASKDPYFSDWVVPYFLTRPSKSSFVFKPLEDAEADLDFIYVKIYLRESGHHAFVRSDLQAMAQKILSQQKIINWHFVRYSDPEFHIRLRVKVRPKERGEVLNRIYDWLDQLMKKNRIIDFSSGPFRPEVNRYGGKSAVTAFFEHAIHQSQFAINFLSIFKSQNQDFEYAVTLVLYDTYIAAFSEDRDSMVLLKALSYEAVRSKREIGEDQRKKLILEYEKILKLNSLEPLLEEFRPEVIEYAKRMRRLEMKRELSQPINYIISSVIHMLLNRLGLVLVKHEKDLFQILYGYKMKQLHLKGTEQVES